MDKTLLSVGHGYSAQALATVLRSEGWTVIGTTRSADKARALEREGIEPLIWPGQPLPLERATHLLSSVGPEAGCDPVLAREAAALEGARHLRWVGYLSTTGVYGDQGGGWVDESTPCTPVTARGRARLQAESEWQALARRTGVALHVFRLAGIYGPGRGPFAKLRAGRAQQVIKPGQVFSRIHVDDIAQVLAASIRTPDPGAIYNVCDDDPAPPQDVLAYAAQLLGVPAPPQVPFEQAELSAMARSFYADNKRVRNDRIRDELRVRLRYPDYRSGLAAVLRAEATKAASEAAQG